MQHLVWKVLFWYRELSLTFQLRYFKCCPLHKSSEKQLPPLTSEVSLGSSQVIVKGFQNLDSLLLLYTDVIHTHLPLLSGNEACSSERLEYAVRDPTVR